MAGEREKRVSDTKFWVPNHAAGLISEIALGLRAPLDADRNPNGSGPAVSNKNARHDKARAAYINSQVVHFE